MEKKNEKKMIIRCFSTDRKLSKILDDYAESQDRSVSWIVRQALKSYLPAYQTIEKPSKYYNDEKGILRERK